VALSNGYLDLRKRERKTNKEFVVWVMKPRQWINERCATQQWSGACMRNSAICTWLWIRRRMERAARDLSKGETNIKWSQSWWNEWEEGRIQLKEWWEEICSVLANKRRPLMPVGHSGQEPSSWRWQSVMIAERNSSPIACVCFH
jgi:hypothetical protein